jgi:hypothetical protein
MKKAPQPSGLLPLLIASGLIALGLGVPFAVRGLTGPEPVINLDAGEHTITMNVICDGDRVSAIETYVDGVYQMTNLLPPDPPQNFRVVPTP